MADAVLDQSKQSGNQQAPPAGAKDQPPEKGGFRLSSAFKWVGIPLILLALAVGVYMYWSYSSVRGPGL